MDEEQKSAAHQQQLEQPRKFRNLFRATYSSIRSEAWFFLALSIIALIFPFLFGIAFELLFAIALTTMGLITLFQSFTQEKSIEWRLVTSGLLFLLTGAFLLFQPVKGLITVTALIGIYFALQGVLKIFWGFSLQSSQKGWMIVSGFLSLFFSFLILGGLPFSAAWTVGVVVGVDSLFFSMALFSLLQSMKDKELSQEPHK